MSQKAGKITAITHALIVRPHHSPRQGSILIRDGKILEILHDQFPSLPRGVSRIDAGTRFVCPGFIDLHVHGAGGYHFIDKPYRNLAQIAAALFRCGTTAFLPTVSAASPPEILDYIKFIRGVMSRGPLKGSVLGLNLEGPFLSIGKRGAQPLKTLRPPDPALLEEFLSAADGLVRIMTLAPELEGALPLVKRLCKAGVIAAIGHTQADYGTTRKALDSGLSYATHIFNSYSPLHHRDPGALAALLEDDRVNLELIADGVHVSPVMIRLLFRLKAFEKIILVTDGTVPIGCKIKKFTMGGREVGVEGGMACLRDGTLVGSVIPINLALKNLVEYTGEPFHRALSLATLHPARVLGLAEKKGDLREGMDADLVVMDRKFNIYRTIAGGKVVHPAP